MQYVKRNDGGEKAKDNMRHQPELEENVMSAETPLGVSKTKDNIYLCGPH